MIRDDQEIQTILFRIANMATDPRRGPVKYRVNDVIKELETHFPEKFEKISSPWRYRYMNDDGVHALNRAKDRTACDILPTVSVGCGMVEDNLRVSCTKCQEVAGHVSPLPAIDPTKIGKLERIPTRDEILVVHTVGGQWRWVSSNYDTVLYAILCWDPTFLGPSFICKEGDVFFNGLSLREKWRPGDLITPFVG